MTYTEFKKLKINTTAIGWEPAGKEEAYFCTPKGAKIIGRAGVDGIHYCTVRALGETIFAVSPMNLPGQYVHPIARNLTDLLRLHECQQYIVIGFRHGCPCCQCFSHLSPLLCDVIYRPT